MNPPNMSIMYGMNQGVTKRCHLSWLTNSTLVYEPKCGGRGGLRGLSQWVQLCANAHGAQINFGDLTPYTYERKPSSSFRRPSENTSHMSRAGRLRRTLVRYARSAEVPYRTVYRLEPCPPYVDWRTDTATPLSGLSWLRSIFTAPSWGHIYLWCKKGSKR